MKEFLFTDDEINFLKELKNNLFQKSGGTLQPISLSFKTFITN